MCRSKCQRVKPDLKVGEGIMSRELVEFTKGGKSSIIGVLTVG